MRQAEDAFAKERHQRAHVIERLKQRSSFKKQREPSRVRGLSILCILAGSEGVEHATPSLLIRVTRSLSVVEDVRTCTGDLSNVELDDITSAHRSKGDDLPVGDARVGALEHAARRVCGLHEEPK